MGISAGGLIIPFEGTLQEAVALVEKLNNTKLYKSTEIYLDTRLIENYSLAFISDHLIIYHADYSLSMFEEEQWSKKLSELGLLDQLIVFGMFDSGSYYVYGIFENAQLIRSISQNVDEEIKQTGILSAFEAKWLNATIFYEFEYEDQDGDWQTKNIEGADFDADSIEEWEEGNICKVYYIDDHENAVPEHDMVYFLFSELSEQILGCNILNVENIKYVNMSTIKPL